MKNHCAVCVCWVMNDCWDWMVSSTEDIQHLRESKSCVHQCRGMHSNTWDDEGVFQVLAVVGIDLCDVG